MDKESAMSKSCETCKHYEVQAGDYRYCSLLGTEADVFRFYFGCPGCAYEPIDDNDPLRGLGLGKPIASGRFNGTASYKGEDDGDTE